MRAIRVDGSGLHIEAPEGAVTLAAAGLAELARGGGRPAEAEIARLLRQAGIPVPPRIVVSTEGDAVNITFDWTE